MANRGLCLLMFGRAESADVLQCVSGEPTQHEAPGNSILPDGHHTGFRLLLGQGVWAKGQHRHIRPPPDPGVWGRGSWQWQRLRTGKSAKCGREGALQTHSRQLLQVCYWSQHSPGLFSTDYVTVWTVNGGLKNSKCLNNAKKPLVTTFYVKCLWKVVFDQVSSRMKCLPLSVDMLPVKSSKDAYATHLSIPKPAYESGKT